MEPTTPRWTQRLDRMVIVIILSLEAGSLVMAVSIMAYGGAPAWAYLVLFASMALPIALFACARIVVRLDDDRLRWSFRPIWRSGVPYDAIEGVEVVRIDAMRDFGGWGPRFGKRAFGVVARSGGAVRLARSDKKRDLVLTCDEPDALAAAILERALRAQTVA